MLVNKKSIYYFSLLTDIVITIFVLFLSFFIRYNSVSNIVFEYQVIFFVPFIWYLSTKSTRLYDEYRSRSFAVQLIALLKSIFIFLIGLIVYYFLFKIKYIDRRIVLYFSILFTLIISFKYYVSAKIFAYFRSKGKNVRNVLLLGAGKVGEYFYNIIEENPNFGYRLIGILDDEKRSFLNGKYLGTIDALEEILVNEKVDDVVVALPQYAEEKLKKVVLTVNKHGKRVRIIPDYFKFITGKVEISIFGDIPIITLRKEPLEEVFWRFMKRSFDILFSINVIIFLLSWITPLIFVLNKLSGSPGPVLFKQDRIGKDNKIFRAYKFRSMYVDVSKNRADFKAVKENDERITPIGKFLRKSNLDELPQFFNVLIGDMSIVGPRPHAIAWHKKYSEYVEEIQLRHRVRPGITGWAQINGYRGDVEDEELNKIRTRKRIELDLWYIENWSFLLDIQIILKTVWNMIKGDPNAY